MLNIIHIRSNSIQQKLLNWLLILLIPLLLFGTISAYFLANYFANLAYDRALFRTALALADQVEIKAGVMVVDIPESTLDLIEYDKDDWIYYQIQDPHQRVVLGEPKLTLPKDRPKLGASTFYDAKLEHKKLRMVAFSLPLTATKISTKISTDSALIVIGETTAKRKKMADEIMAIMLMPQILLIVLITFLVNLGVRRGLISLENLKNLISKRLSTDTHPLEEKNSPQELQPLLHAMNELLVKVKGAADARHQFIANASHQLKTPLAGLKLQAEAAMREGDIENVHHALKQISLASDNLSRLTQQLLSLARAEPEGNNSAMFSAVDLVSLVNHVTAEWVPKALERGIDLGLNCQLLMLKISGDAILLQELLNNLIDNAIRYNKPGSKVTVSLEMAEAVVLSVQDDGLGITPDEQQKVFERFYRVLGTAESGCGLGLAIVREIAHQHHARVELCYLDVQQSTGTVVKVTFHKGDVLAD